jgi:hypothetical protein
MDYFTPPLQYLYESGHGGGGGGYRDVRVEGGCEAMEV